MYRSELEMTQGEAFQFQDFEKEAEIDLKRRRLR